MITRHIMLASVLLLVSVLACNAGDENPGIERATGTVMGYVTDISTGLPVGGVTVEIKSVPPPTVAELQVTTLYTYTDETGFFRRGDVPHGDITVKVSKEGYRTPPVQVWGLSPGGIADLVFELSPGQDPPSKFEGNEQEAWPPDHGGEK